MGGKVPAKNENRVDRIVQAIRELFEGRSNAVGSVTLRASQTTTDVTAPNCGPDSRIFLSPTTSNAAAAMTNVYVSSVGAGTFTLTHSSTSTTDRTFYWLALG